MSNRPNLKHYRKAVFWDTDFETLDWDKNRLWIIRRVFEYGGEEEILETIRFYGEEAVKEILSNIADERKAENREESKRPATEPKLLHVVDSFYSSFVLFSQVIRNSIRYSLTMFEKERKTSSPLSLVGVVGMREIYNLE